MFSSIKKRLSDLFFTIVGFAMAYTLVPLHEGFQKLQVGRTDSVLKARLKLILLVPIVLLVILPITVACNAISRMVLLVIATLATIISALKEAYGAWNHVPMSESAAAMWDLIEHLAHRDAQRIHGGF